MYNIMRVQKRNGNYEDVSFDKILRRIQSLCIGEEFTKKLIKDIDMKILAGPYAKYCDVTGNRGLTCVTIIETSHIALHSWDENDPALVQLDVYSCKDLDEKIVFDYLYKFQPVRMSYRYFDRETNFKLIKVKR